MTVTITVNFRIETKLRDFSRDSTLLAHTRLNRYWPQSTIKYMKNVSKKGLCWQANIGRHGFSHDKALSCFFYRC